MKSREEKIQNLKFRIEMKKKKKKMGKWVEIELLTRWAQRVNSFGSQH